MSDTIASPIAQALIAAHASLTGAPAIRPTTDSLTLASEVFRDRFADLVDAGADPQSARDTALHDAASTLVPA